LGFRSFKRKEEKENKQYVWGGLKSHLLTHKGRIRYYKVVKPERFKGSGRVFRLKRLTSQDSGPMPRKNVKKPWPEPQRFSVFQLVNSDRKKKNGKKA